MAATRAGMSFLFLRKSTIRYFCLWSPPRSQEVIRPWLLRPARFAFFSTRLRSGSFFVRSSFVRTVIVRTPGDVGLYLRIPIVRLLPLRPSDALEEFDLVARLEYHNGLLPSRAASDGPAAAFRLSRHVHRLDVDDLHLEKFF